MTEGSFSRVGVVGLGTMGAGIAEVLARGGLAVVGIEVNQDALERGRGHLEGSTGRAVKRGKLTEDAQRRSSAGSRCPPTSPTSATATS